MANKKERTHDGKEKKKRNKKQQPYFLKTSRAPPLTCTSWMNDITRETKGQAKRKKQTMNEKKRQLAQPQTLTQGGGHEIACLLN